jgi:tripartite-type tricarboxylate transporter receptor subunit TctC
MLTGWERSVAAAALVLAMPWPMAAAPAQAQGYPSKQIIQIVPFAAGGPSDTLGRLLSDHVGRQFGQQIVVENVKGAGGTLGMERAAKAVPDGYTVFTHHGALTAAPALYANLRVDPRTAFEPMGLINTGPMVMLSRKTLETTTLKELVAWVKDKGDKASIGFAGVGSNSYTCAMVLMQEVGVKLAMVPYTGTGPAMQDLVAGQIDLLCDQATTAVPQIRAATVKAYAVTSAQRLPSLPEVPSNVEAGVPGLAFTIWNAAYVPKGTPKEVIAAWNQAIGKFVTDPAIVKRFADTGTVPFPPEMRSPEAHAKFLDEQFAFFAKLYGDAGLKKEEAK